MQTKDKIRVLLVEDDLNLGNLLQDYLEMENFDVHLCRDGEAGFEAFEAGTYDICLLDVMMPKKDGFTLAKQIKEKNQAVPILFLTAKSLKEDKINGFTIGADDYITKPFDEEELVLRIHAVLKRTQGDPMAQKNDETKFKIGKYTFDYANHALSIDDDVRRITKRESEILRLLYLYKNRILKREEALVSIWGENDYFHGRSFDVFITKLRKYLKKDSNVKIENVHGVGFMLIDEKN
ncbi:response regulator transcription factor [Microscilla marina]|uniref:RprY n=1 Tax=Microscilla marina ATCC 23134 TaxID=313606 RepID=A1ZFJ6_MICM2|nr:response regulator transcription factor [Microscilla marina]EAY30770.1 RprY [Microscilla marina ATCC 23134]